MIRNMNDGWKMGSMYITNDDTGLASVSTWTRFEKLLLTCPRSMGDGTVWKTLSIMPCFLKSVLIMSDLDCHDMRPSAASMRIR